MFQKNDYVFYGSGGVCKIVDVQAAPLDGMPKDRLYYVMHSVHDVNSMMYVPVDSECVFLRALITAEEAQALLADIPRVALIVEENAKRLRERYQEHMRRYMPEDWVLVLKTVQARLDEPRPLARRISETERSYAEAAKRNLCTELALVLDHPTEEITADVMRLIREFE